MSRLSARLVLGVLAAALFSCSGGAEQGSAPSKKIDLLSGIERRVARSTPLFSLGVAVIRLTDGLAAKESTAHPLAGRRTRVTMDGLEDRQRVDRWLEESQYLLGRLIPGYLEDRERLKARLAGSEADCQRLRLEVDGLRREVSGLLAELQHQRNERGKRSESSLR